MATLTGRHPHRVGQAVGVGDEQIELDIALAEIEELQFIRLQMGRVLRLKVMHPQEGGVKDKLAEVVLVI